MRVTVGVSGGIAAYKSAELVRALQRQAFEVHVVMTEAACRFVQPLTFSALTGHKVITSLWDDSSAAEGSYEAASEQNAIEHIGEATWADALDHIELLLDDYAHNPDPHHARVALAAIKAIIDEVSL